MEERLNTFRLTRIYSDAEGHSRFEAVDIPLTDAGKIGFLSGLQETKGIIFRKVAPDYDYELHNAPARQYLFVLDGEIEIETSLGESRRFVTGDVILLEDTVGHGHRTKNVKNAVRRSVFVLV